MHFCRLNVRRSIQRLVLYTHTINGGLPCFNVTKHGGKLMVSFGVSQVLGSKKASTDGMNHTQMTPKASTGINPIGRIYNVHYAV